MFERDEYREVYVAFVCIIYCKKTNTEFYQKLVCICMNLINRILRLPFDV